MSFVNQCLGNGMYMKRMLAPLCIYSCDLIAECLAGQFGLARAAARVLGNGNGWQGLV